MITNTRDSWHYMIFVNLYPSLVLMHSPAKNCSFVQIRMNLVLFLNMLNKVFCDCSLSFPDRTCFPSIYISILVE